MPLSTELDDVNSSAQEQIQETVQLSSTARTLNALREYLTVEQIEAIRASTTLALVSPISVAESESEFNNLNEGSETDDTPRVRLNH